MSSGGEPTDRQGVARTSFRRMLIALVVVGLAMVAAALIYLGSYGAMSGTLILTVVVGVFVSVVLGGGLMAAGFYSSNSGLDETVAGAAVSEDVDDPKSRN